VQSLSRGRDTHNAWAAAPRKAVPIGPPRVAPYVHDAIDKVTGPKDDGPQVFIEPGAASQEGRVGVGQRFARRRAVGSGHGSAWYGLSEPRCSRVPGVASAFGFGTAFAFVP
jgi:hypothetical protein